MVDIDLIRDSNVFGGLTKKELEQVAATATMEEYDWGAHVFDEDDAAVKLYLVHEGRVAIRMKSRVGQEVIIDELGPGELTGWSAVLDDQRFTASVSALEPTTLVAFNGAQLRELFHKHPTLGGRVMGNIVVLIASRLGHLRSRLVDEPFVTEWLLSPAQAGPVGGPCMSPTSDMRKMACPACSTPNGPLGVVNETAQYRCRNCGMVFYAPACCE